MYELVKVGENTFYINNPVIIGIYQINVNEICLIDSGIDKGVAKKVDKILLENSWSLKMIINTHSHADHIGGNEYLQNKYNCPIYSNGIENAFIKYPILEPSYLYGGFPFKELSKNKFLHAKESQPTQIAKEVLPDGMEIIEQNGHSFSMIGIKTPDDIWFLGDSLTSENTINKYHIPFLYNVKESIKTLNVLKTLKGNLFIPAHDTPTNDIANIININIDKINEVCEKIKSICIEPTNFETILKKIFDGYNLLLDVNQYVLVGSTIRSYLSYLKDEKVLEIVIQDNMLLWTAV